METTVVRIQVFGRPAPKGSRVAKFTKAGKLYTYSASKHEAPWVEEVRQATQNVMRHHGPPQPPYRVELSFQLPKPQRSRSNMDHPTAHDLDKLARAVIDGLVKGGAMLDDRHVVELHASKSYAADREQAGVTAYVSEASAVQQVA